MDSLITAAARACCEEFLPGSLFVVRLGVSQGWIEIE
jgi:hypothetical protein